MWTFVPVLLVAALLFGTSAKAVTCGSLEKGVFEHYSVPATAIIHYFYLNKLPVRVFIDGMPNTELLVDLNRFDAKSSELQAKVREPFVGAIEISPPRQVTALRWTVDLTQSLPLELTQLLQLIALDSLPVAASFRLKTEPQSLLQAEQFSYHDSTQSLSLKGPGLSISGIPLHSLSEFSLHFDFAKLNDQDITVRLVEDGDPAQRQGPRRISPAKTTEVATGELRGKEGSERRARPARVLSSLDPIANRSIRFLAELLNFIEANNVNTMDPSSYQSIIGYFKANKTYGSEFLKQQLGSNRIPKLADLLGKADEHFPGGLTQAQQLAVAYNQAINENNSTILVRAVRLYRESLGM